MKRRHRKPGEPDALDLLEEAAHLLRVAPAGAYAAYLVGTVPFLLGCMFFVAEMGRGARAATHLAGGAFAMTMLFTWMKAWQAMAAEQLLAHLEHRAAVRLGWLRIGVIAAHQLRLHAFGLVLLPVALVAAAPFGWVYAYFQNVTALGVATGGRVHGASTEQAKLWPRQNHFILALVALMGLVVFVNVAVTIYAVPALLRTLFGMENFFATAGWNPLNTTFVSAAGCLTFLIIDPFSKVVYVLRCFHGASLRSGVDLLVQVRGAVARGSAFAAALGLVTLVAPHAVRAEEPPPAETATIEALEDSGVADAKTLDAAIDHVLAKPEFAWRLPREETPDTDDGERGLVARFFQAVFEWMRAAVRWLGDILEAIIDFFFRDRDISASRSGGTGLLGGVIALLNVLLPVLGAILLAVILWLGWRWWAQSRVVRVSAPVEAVEVQLEREDITADQLPEDEWARLARELLARGEVRLALRAFFLGTLAALGARGALVLARHKSNRDYERELARRGAPAGAGELVAAFAENRRVLEQTWYGRHAVTPGEIDRYQANVARLRGGFS